MRIARMVVAALALVSAGACSSLSEVEPAARVATVEIVSGDAQEFVCCGLWEPLSLRALDDAGAPVSGVSVNWHTTLGSVLSQAVMTAADGIAQADLDLEAVGTATVTASIGGEPVATFTVVSRNGPVFSSFSVSPAEVDVTSGPATITVTVDATTDYMTIGWLRAKLVREGESDHLVPWTELAIVSGDGNDGTWQVTIEIPQGAPAGVYGAWQYLVTSGGACGCLGYPRVISPPDAMAGYGPSYVTVVSTP